MYVVTETEDDSFTSMVHICLNICVNLYVRKHMYTRCPNIELLESSCWQNFLYENESDEN